MKYWYTTDFVGHCPVGVSAVIAATTEMGARDFLARQLREHGLNPEDAYTAELDLIMRPGAIILQDGDY